MPLVSLEQLLPLNRSPLLRSIVALCCGLATTVLGDFTGHSFEKLGVSSRAVQRPDGNIWVVYEEPLDQRNVVNSFDVPRLFKTAIVRSNGEHIPGSDRLFEVGNRFTYGFFAMAVQADNKLLLGTETGDFLRLNADGSRDTSFNPAVTNVVGAVVVQPDGKIIVAPELVRLNPDGTKDSTFSSPVTDASSAFLGLQSNGKILVSLNTSPYLSRLKSDGSVDASFSANLSVPVYSGEVLPNDAILLRLAQFDPNGGTTTFTFVRLLPDGSVDPSFHRDPRLDYWYAVQPDGKILAGFRNQATHQYFFGRMNVDGSLDSSYQTYPLVVADANTLPISAVFVQPDGSILAEIIVPVEGQQFLRFSSSGVLDPASKRFFTIPAAVTKLAPQPDGKLLATGDFYFVDGVKTGPLIRLDHDGNLDAAFPPVVSVGTPRGVDLALQRNDSILFSVTSGHQFPQMRLTPDGNVDPGFPRQNLGHHFKVRSDDRIVTADYGNVVRRLLSDGDVDSTFSPTPVSFGGTYGNSMVDLGIQPDGKVVVAGNGDFFGSIHSIPVRPGLVRLNPDGGVNSSFNPPAFYYNSRLNCVAFQADGKILLGGKLDSGFSPTLPNIIRLNSDGSIDNTFTAAPDYTVSAILVEDSGRILIGGGFTQVNGQPAANVARLQPDGQLDPSFTLDTGGGAVYALARLADGRVVAGGEFGIVASPALVPARLRNISSRMFVDAGDNALISGIIIAGSGEKKLLARAIGPSLAGAGISAPLQDPSLELRNANGALVTSNDDWQQSPDHQAIIDSGIPPGDSRESALIATLPANGSTYTAIVRPARSASGIGLVEIYDLDPPESSAWLANISSRGNVLSGDKAMISGFIVDGSPSMGPVKVVVRGIGPTIPIPGALQDPSLELHDGDAVAAVNDNWKQTQQSEVEATGIPPADNRESALLRWIPPGPHTTVLRGKNAGTGIGLLEIYDTTK
jgi:uncharacterized delta-60 repeat protein